MGYLAIRSVLTSRYVDVFSGPCVGISAAASCLQGTGDLVVDVGVQMTGGSSRTVDAPDVSLGVSSSNDVSIVHDVLRVPSSSDRSMGQGEGGNRHWTRRRCRCRRWVLYGGK